MPRALLDNDTVDFAYGRASRVDELAQIEVDGEYVAGFVPMASSPPACLLMLRLPFVPVAGRRRSNGCATPRPCLNGILRR